MKKLYIVILAFPLLLHAQQERSLFWEISGNGLAKKSYLYGTMHVSDKVSYHLPDSFYEHLLAADIVANESDPETWHGVVESLSQRQTLGDAGFYSAFAMQPVSRIELASLFRNSNYFSSMLSGLEDGGRADYQENTVLDMFIHQTGRKYKKKSVGLESAQESLMSIFRLEEKDVQPAEANRDILVKLLKNGNFQESLRQYYREKDIYMLDSIYKLIFSKNGHDILITKRNAIMANSIDSLARTGSLFAGVGVAHLAGKQGMIEMLRAKGYTLKPASDVASDAGRRRKKMIEEYFPHTGFDLFADDDKMIQVPLNRNKFRNGANIGSPDYDNGGVLNLKRIPLNDFLSKEPFSHKTVDSLLYENIPGDIVKKEFITGAGYSGYDVRNVTKTGNAQRYRFYVTPLEIILVSMIGNGNYVRKYEAQVFDKISLAEPSSDWKTVVPLNAGFSVEVPAYHTQSGVRPEALTAISVQAFDPADKSYYFVSEQIMDNVDFLEESAYEHRQLHYEFLKKHKTDTTATALRHGVFYSQADVHGKKVKLASVINGSRYYLLGAVNADPSKAERFFKSFSTYSPKRSDLIETYADSAYGFSIDVPKKANGQLLNRIDKSLTKPQYMSESAHIYRFQAQNGYGISVTAKKYHPYYSIENDSVVSQVREQLTALVDPVWTVDAEYDDYDVEPTLSLLKGKRGIPDSRWDDVVSVKEHDYEIVTEKVNYDPKTQTHTVDAMVSRAGASQAIRQRVIVRPDGELRLSALVDRNYANDDVFLERAIASLKFNDDVRAQVFSEKIDQFIQDALSEEDSIRKSALESVHHLEIGAKHYDKLEAFLSGYEFGADEQWQAEAFFQKLADADTKRAIPFLLNYYRNNEGIASIQLKILSILANSKLKDRYKIIQELMEEDLPLSDNAYEITSLFANDFTADLENSRALFPAVLQFCGTDEYRTPVMAFCLALRDKGYIRNKSLKTAARQMLINANSEYKRVANRKRKSIEPLSPYQTSNLIDYIEVLYGQSSDSKIASFLEKCRKLDIAEVNNEFLRLDVVEGKHDRAALNKALQNPSQRFIAIQLMSGKKDDSYRDDLTDEEIAASAVEGYLNRKLLSTELLHSEIVDYQGETVSFYFFRTETENPEDDDDPIAQLQMVAFINQGKRINPGAYRINTPFDDVDDDEKRIEKFQSMIHETLYGQHQRASTQEVFGMSEFIQDY